MWLDLTLFILFRMRDRRTMTTSRSFFRFEFDCLPHGGVYSNCAQQTSVETCEALSQGCALDGHPGGCKKDASLSLRVEKEKLRTNKDC